MSKMPRTIWSVYKRTPLAAIKDMLMMAKVKGLDPATMEGGMIHKDCGCCQWYRASGKFKPTQKGD